MAPSKAPTAWDDEESDSSSPASPAPIARRGKFDDEEDDSDVLESWDAAEDSEVEQEKAKKAAEAKAKAEAEAKANHKSKSQRIKERQEANMKKRMEEEEEESEEDETEADRRARLAASEKASDLKNAEDLFAGVGGVSNSRGAKPITVQEGDDPSNAVDLSSMKLFKPASVKDFSQLRETLAPLLLASSKKPQFESFTRELAKQLVRDMNSEQIKKIASSLTTISNEKMREEKAAEKGGKKTKAAKTKISLSANRDITSKADTTLYDDGLEDDDFM